MYDFLHDISSTEQSNDDSNDGSSLALSFLSNILHQQESDLSYELLQSSNSSISNPFGFIYVPSQTNVDIVAFTLGCFLVLCNFMAMGLVFTKYKRMAVRSKHPFLMTTTLIFNAIMFIGYSVSFNNF